MDFGITISLMALAIIFIFLSLKTVEKTLFLVLSAVLFIVLGLSLFATPLTTPQVAPAYNNGTVVIPPTVIQQNISIPSPFNSVFALIFILFGLFLAFKGLLAGTQQATTKPKKEESQED